MPHPVFDVETTVGEDRAATAPSTGENGPGCVEGVLLVVCWGVGGGGGGGGRHWMSLIPRSTVSVSVTHTGHNEA